jgi:YD repeat-containing protein
VCRPSDCLATSVERPVIALTVDRWGNTLTQTDARNAAWVSTATYNARNQVVTQTDANDNTTHTYYDALGQQSAVQDARSNVNAQFFDAAGHVVREVHADGGVVRKTYDALGNLKEQRDAENQLTRYTYDTLGHLLSQTQTAGLDASNTERTLNNYTQDTAFVWHNGTQGTLTQRFEVDELGRRTRAWDGNGAETQYLLDVAGNTTRTSVEGQVQTRASFDALGHKTAEADGNGAIATWRFDAWGTLQAHTDIGGSVYTYFYDSARQLTGQTSTGGWVGANGSRVAGQELHYFYDAAGQLTGIDDLATDAHTRYAYDLAGHRVRENTTQILGGQRIVAQDNTLAYDNVGRLRWAGDGTVFAHFNYDANGNRTEVFTRHTGAGVATSPTGEPIDTDRYYGYDAMNRQVVVDAATEVQDTSAAGLANVAITAGVHVLGYDHNGNRITDTYLGRRITASTSFSEIPTDFKGRPQYQSNGTTYAAADAILTDRNVFDAANRLVQVYHDADASAPLPTQALTVQSTTEGTRILHNTLIDTRFYDGAGRVVHSGPGMGIPTAFQAQPLPDGYVKALNGIDPATVGTDQAKPATGLGSEAQDYVYDAQGHLLVQQTSNAAYTTGITRTDYTAYDGAGNLLHYDTTVYGSGNNSGYTNHYDLAYLRGEGYRNISTAATSSKLLPGTTTQTIDANGHLIGIHDATQTANNRSFINDAAGVVLQVTQAGNTERQFVVGGEVLARTGMGVDPLQPVVKDSTTGMPNFAAVGPAGINGAPGSQNPNGLDLRVSGYASIASSTATQPSSYTARAGETLQSIALAVYGDASLWYRIADANGMGSSNNLRAGQVLSLPAQIGGLHNNAGTVTPYDPGKVVGDTSPNLPQPQAHGGGGCGGLGQLIVVVVAVVATIYTAGAAASLLSTEAAGMSTWAAGAAALSGGAGLSLGGAVAVGAIGAAAGSIASQLTGMALGVQQDFSWKQVGMSAIGGAVSGGVASYGAKVAEAGSLLKTSAIARAAVSNAISQGVNIAVGNQHSFQWKGVAASAAGAWAGQATNDALLGKVQLDRAGEVMRDAAGRIVHSTSDLTKGFGDMFGAASGFAAASLSGIASGTVASIARAGRVSVQQVASDAFGNALANQFVEGMAQRIGSSVTRTGNPFEYTPKQVSFKFEGNDNVVLAANDTGTVSDAGGVVMLQRVVVTASRSGKEELPPVGSPDPMAWPFVPGVTGWEATEIPKEILPNKTIPIDTSTVMRAAHDAQLMARRPDVTHDQLINGLKSVNEAIPRAGSQAEFHALHSAALSLHEAGATRGLLQPGETVGSSEFRAIATGAMAFGGSQGGTPSGPARSLGYTGPSNRSAFRAYAPVNEATSGETIATSSGKAIHGRLASERRASGKFDLVNQPFSTSDGIPIKVPKRVDLRTGNPIAESGYQSARPDAVRFDKEVIIDDKPMNRPIAKDQQEMIRFIKAYEQSNGVLPRTIGIQRYDPRTGAPVVTDLYKPSDFTPWIQ